MKDGDVAVVDEAQEAFTEFTRLHSYVGLLCDTYSAPMFSNTKVSQSLVQIFSEPLGQAIVTNLAHLYRVCALETMYFKATLPKSWFTKPKKSAAGVAAGAKVDEKKELVPDPLDRRVRNARYWRHLLTQTTGFIVPIIQGIFNSIIITY
jgi:hypothetical protein